MNDLMNKFSVVITSMGRADRIGKYSLKLFPDALVCIPENELEDYARVIPRNRILCHPTGLNNHVAAIQFALDRIDDEVVWSVDDDLIALASNTGRNTAKYKDPRDIYRVFDNTVEMAKGVGAKLFGFAMSGDPKAVYMMDPIRLCATINGGAWGFIGRDPRFDLQSGVNGDVDMVLMHLMKYRVVLVDQRFHFMGVPRNVNVGGGAVWRSDEEYERGAAYLQKKWGKWINFGFRTGNGGKLARARVTTITVKRRQPMPIMT